VGIAAGSQLPVRLAADGYDALRDQVARLARVELRGEAGEEEVVATVAVPGGSAEVLTSDELDREGAERRRAARRLELESEIARAEGKLADERFVERAPSEVVQRERDKLTRFTRELAGLDSAT
jgi:valyl-tRNA synthetase